jgi:predicted metal-binding protein
MKSTTRIGIIICDRYRRCAGGKCLRAMRNREGTFSVYTETDLELAGLTTCDGCPGGNIEYAGEEMVKNGAEIIHLATGMIVGYPPCPFLDTFTEFLEKRYAVKVVIGTHPVPKSYYDLHTALGTWEHPSWGQDIAPIITNETMRAAYD